AVKLGEGFAITMSPDGKWVVARMPSDTRKYTLLPTGPGQSKDIPNKNLVYTTTSVRWFSDNKRLLLSGHEPGKQSRFWICDIDSGKLTPVPPEGVGANGLLSPDESEVLAQSLDRTYAFYPLNGGPPKPFPALRPGEGNPVQWTSDGKALFVNKGDQL